MHIPLSLRRVSQLALTSVAVLAVAAALAGCSAPTATSGASGSASTESASSSSATSTGAAQTLAFDLAASHKGRPRKTPESTLTASWFPPNAELLTGLRQVTDAKQIAALTHAASGNEQFWIERPNDHVRPLAFGSDAVSLLATSTGFKTALVIPVRDVAPEKRGGTAPELAADLKGTPTAYQVLLSGDVGETSFGLRKGSKPGQWLLDPNGELVNWGNAIDAVSRDANFTAEQAYVTHTAFDLGGRPALYITWAVFRDANGKQHVVALHNPPAIKATWAIGAAKEQLRLAKAYDPQTVYGPVLLTPTN